MTVMSSLPLNVSTVMEGVSMNKIWRPSLVDTVKSRAPSAPTCVETSRATIVIASSASVPLSVAPTGVVVDVASIWSKLTGAEPTAVRLPSSISGPSDAATDVVAITFSASAGSEAIGSPPSIKIGGVKESTVTSNVSFPTPPNTARLPMLAAV